MFLAACTALKHTHYVPGCVYRLQAVRTLFLAACTASSVHSMLLAACTAFERTECYDFFDNQTNARNFRIHQYHKSVGFPYCSV